MPRLGTPPHGPPGPLLPPPAREPGRFGKALGGLRGRRAALRRVRPTAEGWVFFATGAAVALAAVNTGNNLLYLVFAAMLTLILVSGVLSESSLRSLEVQRRIDDRVFSNRPAAGTWVLRSTRGRVPHLAIELGEGAAGHARIAGSGVATVPWLRAGAQESRRGIWTFRGRGIHRLDRVRVSTTWPFGILRKWYEVLAQEEILVFPEPAEEWDDVARDLPAGTGAEADASRQGATGDLRGLRDHRPGEDLRLVHWRSTARLRRRVAVEREAEAAGRMEVRVDRPGQGDAASRGEEFERRLSKATAAVLAATGRGAEIVLVLPEGPLPPVRGEAGLDLLLRRLALAELA